LLPNLLLGLLKDPETMNFTDPKTHKFYNTSFSVLQPSVNIFDQLELKLSLEYIRKMELPVKNLTERIDDTSRRLTSEVVLGNTGENVFFTKLWSQIGVEVHLRQTKGVPYTGRRYRTKEFYVGGVTLEIGGGNPRNETLELKEEDLGVMEMYLTPHRVEDIFSASFGKRIIEMAALVNVKVAFYNAVTRLMVYVNLKVDFTSAGAVFFDPEMKCFPADEMETVSLWVLLAWICL
jgi:hypothetical protein